MYGLRKTLSTFLLLLLFPLIIAQVTLSSARPLLTDPAVAKRVVRETGFYDAIRESVLERLALSAEAELGIPRDQIGRILGRVLPANQLVLLAEQAIDGLYSWAWGPNVQPVILLDLTETRQAVKAGLRQALLDEVAALPICTPQDLAKLRAGSQAGMPPCKAPDERINTAAVDHLLQNMDLNRLLPAQVEIGTMVAGSEGPSFWEAQWRTIQWVRMAMQLIPWGWVGIGLLLLFLALLNLDHWYTPFGWLAAALLLGSFPLLLGSMGGVGVLLPSLRSGGVTPIEVAVVGGLVGSLLTAIRTATMLLFLSGLACTAAAVAGSVSSREKGPPPLRA